MKKVIFIHIQKCGGRSIEQVVQKYCSWVNCNRTINHFYFRDFSDLEISTSDYNFTIVRNPWDRAVSWYFYHCVSTSPAFDSRGLYTKYESFRDWVVDGMKVLPKFDLWDYRSNKWCMHDYLTRVDADGRIGGYTIEHVYKLEELSDTSSGMWEKLKLDLGVPKHEKFPHANVTNCLNPLKYRRHKDYRKHYDAESIEMVRNICALDIEFFGYEF
jgi:hypothetical protein